MRQGRAGVGGKSRFAIGQVVDSFYSKDGGLRVRVAHSPETKRRWFEESRDATAAVVGLGLAAFGTLIWGYGDLLGKLFEP